MPGAGETRRFETLHGPQLRFTALGLGTAAVGNLYSAKSEAEAQGILQAAWDAGVRYFDTAPLYGLGLAETRLGRFLYDKPRDSYVVSTKFGRILERADFEEAEGLDQFPGSPSRKIRFDFSYDGVARSLEASLERTGLDHIDVFLCHHIDPVATGSASAAERHLASLLDGGMKRLDELRSAGVVKAVGAGLNYTTVAERLARQGGFDVMLLAGRYPLLEQQPLETFFPYCAHRGIGVIAGGPFNSGILARGPVPGARFDYAPASDDVLQRVERIDAICREHGVPLATAALAFVAAHPVVISTIPGASTPEEAMANVVALETPTPRALWSDLKEAGLISADAPTPG